MNPTINLYTRISDQLEEASNKAKMDLLTEYYKRLRDKDRDKFNVLFGTFFNRKVPSDNILRESGRFMWDRLREYEMEKELQLTA